MLRAHPRFLTLPSTADDPAALAASDPAARLVLTVLRGWIAPAPSWELAWRGLVCAIGVVAAEDALRGFARMAAVLGRHSRRPLHLHAPGSAPPSRDECCLLTLIAAVQAGQSMHIEAMVRWLARANGHAALWDAASTLANALGDHDVLLPYAAPGARAARAAGGPHAA